MPEKALRFNKAAMAHNSAGFCADDVGDEPEDLRRNLQRSAWRGNAEDRVAGTYAIDDADGEGRNFRKPLVPIVNQAAPASASHQKTLCCSFSSDKFGERAKVCAGTASIEPDFGLADGNEICARILRDGVESFVAGIGLGVYGQKFGFLTDESHSAVGH